MAEHRGVAMPCNPAEELPESVRKYLPLHAQEIYGSAFSSARISYTSRGLMGQEKFAHRAARAAVKRSYRKTSAGWIER